MQKSGIDSATNFLYCCPEVRVEYHPRMQGSFANSSNYEPTHEIASQLVRNFVRIAWDPCRVDCFFVSCADAHDRPVEP